MLEICNPNLDEVLLSCLLFFKNNILCEWENNNKKNGNRYYNSNKGIINVRVTKVFNHLTYFEYIFQYKFPRVVFFPLHHYNSKYIEWEK